MLIIGLVGGNENRRLAVAAQMMRSRRVRFKDYALVSPESPAARVGVLRAVALQGIRQEPPFNEGLILTHVKTAEEAELIRGRGGLLWHIEGVPSGEIEIRHSDLLVSHQVGGHRHYLDPVDAVSEELLRLRRGVV